MAGRGLVLGGGGPIGFGWYSGLATGLAEAGIDLRTADVVLGTSAGAIAGAWIAAGCDLDELVRTARARPHADGGRNLADDVDFDLVVDVYSHLERLDEPASEDVCMKIGELATRVPPLDGDPDWYVRRMAGELPEVRWPDRLGAVVVGTTSGRVRVLRARDGIELARGVAASSAAPGIIAPVAIDGEPAMDGGARSVTNADLIARSGLDTALVVTPVPREAPIVGAAGYRMLDAELRVLHEAGIETFVVAPGDREATAFGFDLLNTARMDAAVDAGIATGREVAHQLTHW